MITFVNGIFDLLHPGHIYLLDFAKKLGGNLVVAINSDASVKRLKGENRPIYSENERAYMLRALKGIDCVCIFEEDTPLELIKRIKPKFIVKGDDYKKEDVVGYGLAEVIICHRIPFSTTEAIRRIKAYM